MSSGGTSTTSSGPPQAFIDAFQGINKQAQTVASDNADYQKYPGQIVADLSPDQTAAISTVQNAQGIAAPYINSAADYINKSTAPLDPALKPYTTAAMNNFGIAGQQITPTQFSAGQVGQYESPYTKDVVNATQAEFNNQNEQQQQQVKGNAISAGAWGGDRSAVAQGITAGQQALAQAPVIAGLQNTGYQQALQEFNQQQQTGIGAQQASQQLALGAGQGIAALGGQQLGAAQANAWLNSQAGYGLANLGNQALSSTLTGANAQLGAGALEQQQAQANLNVPYEQFTAGQAYPYQQTSWLANIAEGLGGASGGVGSTTSPGASVGSQIAGAGLAGAGILGATGAFGSSGSSGGSGWLSSLFSGGGGGVEQGLWDLKRGGPVPHRAPGGSLPFGIDVPTGTGIIGGSDIPGVSVSSVVPSGAAKGIGHPNLMKMSTGSTTTSNDGGAGLIGDALTVAKIVSLFARGGNVEPLPHHLMRTGIAAAANDDFHARPPRLQRFASGGSPLVDTVAGHYEGSPDIPMLKAPSGGIAGSTGSGSISDYLTGQQSHAFTGTPASLRPAKTTTAQVDPSHLTTDQINSIVSQLTPGFLAATQPATSDWAGSQARGGGIMPRRDAGGGLDDDEGDLPVPPIPPDQGAPSGGIAGAPGATASPSTGSGSGGHSDLYRTLMNVGLGIMGGTSPQAGVNIGKGALAGLKMSEDQKLRETQQESNNLYRQGLLKDKGNRTDIYSQRVQAMSARDAASAALMAAKAAVAGASHATEGDVLSSAVSSLVGTENPDTGKPWTRADALMHVKGVDARSAHMDRADDLAGRSLDARSAHMDRADDLAERALNARLMSISSTEEYHKAMVGLRRDLGDFGKAKAAVDAAAKLTASDLTGKTKFADALTLVRKGFGDAAPPVAPAAPATAAPLPDPLGIR